MISVSDEVLQEDAWKAASADFMEDPYNHHILGGPNCSWTSAQVLHVDKKTFTAMVLPLREWWATVDLGPKSAAFVPAGNCHLDWDHLFLENPIVEYLDPQRTVTVGAMKAFPTNEEPLHMSPAVAPYSSNLSIRDVDPTMNRRRPTAATCDARTRNAPAGSTASRSCTTRALMPTAKNVEKSCGCVKRQGVCHETCNVHFGFVARPRRLPI